MMEEMLSSLYRKLFTGTTESDLKATQAKADQGDADAQFSLGIKYSSAQEGAPNFVEAAHWYRKAAEQNHTLAQLNLARMYSQGQGVLQDDALALAWIRKAANGGDASAQHSLGMRCHRACVDTLQKGTIENRIEAYKWFRLAAAQGYRGSDAAYELVTLGMTSDEVREGNHRAAAFVSRKPANPQDQ